MEIFSTFYEVDTIIVSTFWILYYFRIHFMGYEMKHSVKLFDFMEHFFIIISFPAKMGIIIFRL